MTLRTTYKRYSSPFPHNAIYPFGTDFSLFRSHLYSKLQVAVGLAYKMTLGFLCGYFWKEPRLRFPLTRYVTGAFADSRQLVCHTYSSHYDIITTQEPALTIKARLTTNRGTMNYVPARTQTLTFENNRTPVSMVQRTYFFFFFSPLNSRDDSWRRVSHVRSLVKY